MAELKERRPFKLKKEYPSEQWQIISFRLIPLKTPVSFRWTVPLNAFFLNFPSRQKFSTALFYVEDRTGPYKIDAAPQH
jgi:hypothetical protein